jgi:hypothetical protein
MTRLALTRSEAAESIGMSLDTFERHVQPHLALVPCGRKRLVPVDELKCWVDANKDRPMVEQLAQRGTSF